MQQCFLCRLQWLYTSWATARSNSYSSLWDDAIFTDSNSSALADEKWYFDASLSGLSSGCSDFTQQKMKRQQERKEQVRHLFRRHAKALHAPETWMTASPTKSIRLMSLLCDLLGRTTGNQAEIDGGEVDGQRLQSIIRASLNAIEQYSATLTPAEIWVVLSSLQKVGVAPSPILIQDMGKRLIEDYHCLDDCDANPLSRKEPFGRDKGVDNQLILSAKCRLGALCALWQWSGPRRDLAESIERLIEKVPLCISTDEDSSERDVRRSIQLCIGVLRVATSWHFKNSTIARTIETLSCVLRHSLCSLAQPPTGNHTNAKGAPLKGTPLDFETWLWLVELTSPASAYLGPLYDSMGNLPRDDHARLCLSVGAALHGLMGSLPVSSLIRLQRAFQRPISRLRTGREGEQSSSLFVLLAQLEREISTRLECFTRCEKFGEWDSLPEIPYLLLAAATNCKSPFRHTNTITFLSMKLLIVQKSVDDWNTESTLGDVLFFFHLFTATSGSGVASEALLAHPALSRDKVTRMMARLYDECSALTLMEACEALRLLSQLSTNATLTAVVGDVPVMLSHAIKRVVWRHVRQLPPPPPNSLYCSLSPLRTSATTRNLRENPIEGPVEKKPDPADVSCSRKGKHFFCEGTAEAARMEANPRGSKKLSSAGEGVSLSGCDGCSTWLSDATICLFVLRHFTLALVNRTLSPVTEEDKETLRLLQQRMVQRVAWKGGKRKGKNVMDLRSLPGVKFFGALLLDSLGRLDVLDARFERLMKSWELCFPP